ncbi:hypothetical protein GCM10018787_02100 [Streptomyces thermodiastaticus]|nr:hypothetical protein GCM10018787_02100 [Streptomyces thermodiastaticus]
MRADLFAGSVVRVAHGSGPRERVVHGKGLREAGSRHTSCRRYRSVMAGTESWAVNEA